MKKNYIAPNTEMATWASMGLMQSITVGIVSASGAGAGGQQSTSNMEDIQ